MAKKIKKPRTLADLTTIKKSRKDNMLNEREKRLSRALISQSGILMIVKKEDINLEGLVCEKNKFYRFEMNGNPGKTYKALTVEAKLGKKQSSNLYVIEQEERGIVRGTFYSAYSNLFEPGVLSGGNCFNLSNDKYILVN